MSLVGFTRIAEYELPVITGTHTDFVAVLKYSDFTADVLALLDDGGGDLRFSSDSAGLNQLACEVVAFDKVGGLIQVWVKVSSASTGAIIHVWGDNTGATQPSLTDTYGRNAVWINDLRSYHLLESVGSTAIDSTGNVDGAYKGSLPTLGANFGQDFDGGNDYVDLTNNAIDFSAFTFSVKANPDKISGTQQIFTSDHYNTPVARTWQWRINGNKIGVICWDTNGTIFINTEGTISLSANTDYIFHFSFDGSNYKTYIDGVKDLDIANSSQIRPLQTPSAVMGVNSATNKLEDFNGEMADLVVRDGAFKSDDFIETEHSNQSAVGAWGVMTDIAGGSGTEQAITVITSEQKTEAQVIDVSELNNIGAITTEIITQVQSYDVSINNQLSVISTEQKTEYSAQAIATINAITVISAEQLAQNNQINIDENQLIHAIQAQQLSESLIVDITTNDAQDIIVVTAEQATQTAIISADQAQQMQSVICEQLTQAINAEASKTLLIDPVTTEQLTESVIVNIDEFSGVLVSVVQTEQLNEFVRANIALDEITNTVITEQLAQFSQQEIEVALNISAAVYEQLTQAEIINIAVSNIATQLNIDIDQISIEMLTPDYTINSLTPTYTINHIH